jgi:indolepyruvate ferredoxin oxidoreductase
MITDYEMVLEELLEGLTPENHALATEIAGLPLGIRGFGHVKERNRLAVNDREAHLLAAFKRGDSGFNADAAE